MPEEPKKLTVPDLPARPKASEKVVMASIPDHPSAVWAERAGIDIAAVGDSLGMVSYGYANTLPMTIDMLARLVAQRRKQLLQDLHQVGIVVGPRAPVVAHFGR